ncbi:Signal transduction histidine kinase [Verrucomicrobium sp. GAS474]|uniref:GAF domain-containing sensor histidine kinase n=1 Tax=Verrucomicrobium sp. GAS474 TaxID=1882831 RepID=UPI00087B1662|nr:GAF domain-containing sensor histidine kinase [Verrucomicrobium sp. GAS474]SDU12490.1 Signal transduction histidine kinase [Verrucomicrobium sp. GAS474]
MMMPPISGSELDRLRVLREYKILDTPPEKILDDVVTLAAYICGSDISQVTLVDEDRQWFKASFGIEATETPRDFSFCAHAIQQPDIFIVPDATQDDRFADNPLVTGEPGIRFYAGSPLITPEGHALGTLCVIDRTPHRMTPEQKSALTVLSRLVMTHLEMRNQSRELARLNEVLSGKTRELERAATLKNRFLANMTHELRTPLNCIIGFSEILSDGGAGPVSADQKGHLDDILASGRHLLELINDLLDIAKIEAGKMSLFPEAFSLPEAIREVSSAVNPLVQKKGITLAAALAPEVKGVVLDKKLFKQVLFNLLSNAIKFTPEGGRVELNVAPVGEGRFSMAVRDTGIGIKPENLARLFKEFAQLEDDQSRQHQGTGLGLALSRKIVEIQGGTITAASEFGKGSLFTVELPRVTSESLALS